HLQQRSRDTLGRAASAAGSGRAAVDTLAWADGGVAAGASGPSGGNRSLVGLTSGLADDDAPRAGAGGALVGVAGRVPWAARQGVHCVRDIGAEDAGRRDSRP